MSNPSPIARRLDPTVLNKFQDEYERSGFNPWRRIAEVSTTIANSAAGATAVVSPILHGHLPAAPDLGNVNAIRPMIWVLGDMPVGVTAAARTRQMRLRARVMFPNVVNSFHIASFSLRRVSAVGAGPGGAVTLDAAVAGSTIAIPELTANMDQLFEAVFAAPADGLYVIAAARNPSSSARIIYANFRLDYRVI